LCGGGTMVGDRRAAERSARDLRVDYVVGPSLTSIKLEFPQRVSNAVASDLSGQSQPGISAVILYKFLDQIVSDYMTHDVVTVPPTMSVRELGQRFKQTDFNSFPVVDNGQVAGVVSKFDYLACFEFTPARMVPRYDDLMRRTVASVMTREFIYVGCDTRLTRVLQLMIEHRLRSLPILGPD